MRRKMVKRFSAGGLMLLAIVVALCCGFTPALLTHATSARGDETPSAAPSGQKPDGTAPEKPSGEQPPEKPGDDDAADKPVEDDSKVNYEGAKVFTASAKEENGNYSSNMTGQNAILISGGNVALKNPTVIKSGASTSEKADFYGTNAAILAHNYAAVTIKGGSVATKAQHANAIFAYGTGTIDVTDTKIETSAANSGAIMVAGGGTMTANNVTATTEGDSSAPIRSDRGGGKMVVNGGTFTSNGIGSPAIYSTAEVHVNNATLTATKSEGVVVEGLNSVELTSVTLTDTNNTLNGNSETYKNIFIYQSMSGDADEGMGTFTAKDSTLTTNNGDDFFITNTTAEINLSNTIIAHNSNGVLLRAQAGKWGKSGVNGGQVLLNASSEEFYGDIVLDNISTLAMDLSDESYYRGALNADNKAKSATLNMSKDSIFVLEGDSYVGSLSNEDKKNSNIYSNGHKLYVGGREVSVNTATPPDGKVGRTGSIPEDEEEAKKKAEAKTEELPVWLVGGAIGAAVFLFVIIAVIIHKKRHKTPPMSGAAVGPSPTPTTPPANINYPTNYPPAAQ